MTGRNNKNTELSALLDGEVRGEQLEQLSQLLSADAQLKGEFEEQRSIKTLLAQLPEYQAPDYMSTRVLGMISEKKNEKKRSMGLSLRMLAAGAGGFAVCMLSVGSYMMATAPQRSEERALAQRNSAADEMVVPAGLSRTTDNIYTSQDWDNASLNNWRNIEVSADKQGNVDDRIEDFLRFAAEAHGYEVMVSSTDGSSAGIPEELLLMVGQDGGSQ